MASLVDDVKSDFSLSLSADYAERCQQARPTLTPSELYQRALRENLRDICGTSLLPYGVAAQVSATLPSAVVLQISTSRDATQPLRPCADTTDEDVLLNAAMQRNSDKRLLRLLLTDGNVEIPALELTTLRVFHGIPIPGEKLLVHKDAEVRNGCIILSENNVTLLGGEVQQLKQDFLAHRRRLEAGYQTSSGLNGAPRFEPLLLGQQYRGYPGPSGPPQTAQGPLAGAAPMWAGDNNNSAHRHNHNHGHGGGGAFHGDHNSGGGGYGRGGGRGGAGGGCGRGNGDRGGYGRGGGDRGRGGGGRGFGKRGGGGYGGDGGRGHGRGRGGGGGDGYSRGRGHAGSYHVDTSYVQPPAEKFPEMNEANFPRLS